MSKGEEYIASILKKSGIKFQQEYILKGVQRKRPLRYDFAIFNNYGQLTFLLEVQGAQHYYQVKQFQPTHLDFTKQQEYDRIKISACLARDIPLFLIPYTELPKIKNFGDIINPKYMAKTKWHNDEVARKIR